MLIPFNSNFVPLYFDLLDQMANRKNSRVIRQMYLVVAICVFWVLFPIFLYCFPPNPFYKHVLFDICALLGLMKPAKLMVSALMTMAIYYYYLVFWKPCDISNNLIMNVMLFKSDNVFPIQTGSNRFSVDKVYKYSKFFMLHYQAFTIALCKFQTDDYIGFNIFFVGVFAVNMEYINTWFILHNLTFFIKLPLGPFWFLINIFLVHMNMLLVDLFTYIVIIMAVLSTTITIILFMQLGQLNQFLSTRSIRLRARSSIQRMRIFRSKFLIVLRDLFHCNQVFGRALLVYILINCPINAYVSMTLLTGKHITFWQMVLLFPFLLQQFTCIFGMHFVAAKYADRVHQPCKRVIHIYLHNLRCRYPTRFRLKLSHYIEAFHTKQRYGLTYGNYGLVTLKALLKVRIPIPENLCPTVSF